MNPRLKLVLLILVLLVLITTPWLGSLLRIPIEQDSSSNPFSSFAARTGRSRGVHLTQEIICPALTNQTLLLSGGKSCDVQITANAKASIRKLKVSADAGGSMSMSYEPGRNHRNELDPGAFTIHDQGLTSGRTYEIVVLQSGGTLTVRHTDPNPRRVGKIHLN